MRGVVVLVIASAAGVGGCSSGGDRFRDWFKKPRSSRQWLEMALDARNADDRRAGVVGLAGSRDATTDWAVKVYDTVARTDTDAMVRCAAVRAMMSAADAGRVTTLIKLLKSADGGVQGVRPAPGPVRWEAAKVLRAIVAAGAHDESQQGQITETLLDRLARDADRNVRLTAIGALAYFPRRPVPTALVDAMEIDDFSVKHAAERSLVVLTGTTHDHDPVAWRQWLATEEDPFANAGAIGPEVLEVEGKSGWQWPWEW